MCGLAGFIDSQHQGNGAWVRDTALKMADSLVHRGPDSGDSWTDADAGLGLGFRRLAVLDLSQGGDQPMISRNNRYVIVYNGEIYNSVDLKRELGQAEFRGHSDTEVVLESCAAWGLEKAVSKMNGMFAFALWDRQERSLKLVRDRLGIKPMYWGAFKGLFLFASELKALKQHPGWTREVNRDALGVYMQHRYVPAPLSIYRGINKLEPGQIVTVNRGKKPVSSYYWTISDVVRTGLKPRAKTSDRDYIDNLDDLLSDSVKLRMVADVPVGAFLSGGVDSASIVAMMQKAAPGRAHTFTIGFNDERFNEAREAAAIARHLGSFHTELYVDAAQARDVIPRLPAIYDEPFADSSQIPTFLVSQMTRKHVTVALSGDGGDELFAGYNRYRTSDLIQRWTRGLNAPMRRSLVSVLRHFSPADWNHLLRWTSRRKAVTYPGQKLHHFASMVQAGPENSYRELISEWNDPLSLVSGSANCTDILWSRQESDMELEPLARLQYLDTLNYLPDDILTKVDRASMAVSLEARTPLLDHRIVEFAWRLPMQLKVRDKQRKWLLRQVLNRYVPEHLVSKRKSGFKVPLEDWLRGPLREWSEELLDEKRLREEGYLNPLMVTQKWRSHLSGECNWKGPLWNVLMFQAWLENN